MYNEETPINVLRLALVMDKIKSGMKKDNVEKVVNRLIADAKDNPEVLKGLCNSLNKSHEKHAFDAGPDLATNDQMLINIREMAEGKGKSLNTVSPELLSQIHQFEHLNNLDKIPDFDLQIIKESMAVLRRTKRVDSLNIPLSLRMKEMLLTRQETTDDVKIIAMNKVNEQKALLS